MRRVLVAGLVVLAGAVATGAGAADEAGKLLKVHRKAAGGKALKRIHSTLLQGTVQGPEGAAGCFTLRLLAPDRSRLDLEAGGLRLSECYNGKSAWRLDGGSLRTLLGVEAKRLRLEALLANGRFADLKKHRILPQPPVTTELDGRSLLAVDFVLDEARTTFLFDARRRLAVGQRLQRGEQSQELLLDDLRPVDGVLEPHALRLRQGSSEWLLRVERVEHNRGVSEADFQFPQLEGAAPLPEVQPLLESLLANQEQLEELREQYTFLVTETESEQGKDGRFRETSTKVYEVTPVAGDFVERLVQKDGKPLDSREQAKVDRKLDKQVEELHKRRDQRRRDRERGKKDKQELAVSDFLRLSHLTSMRRETFRGQEVIAFDFEPAPALRPKNRIESLVGRLAGTIWIDEAARQVARIEARLTRSFKVGGGLVASLAPASMFVFEQEKVNGELWLPSYVEAAVSGRFLLLARFNGKMVRRYSDYQKYEVESTLEIDEPEPAATPAAPR
jgi:hypothetical protein